MDSLHLLEKLNKALRKYKGMKKLPMMSDYKYTLVIKFAGSVLITS